MFLRVFGVIGSALLIACVTGANEDKPADGNAGKLAEAAKVDFVKQIKPILEYNCVGCHREEEAEEQPQNKNLEVAAKNSRRLLRLVYQLLDFLKLEAG